MLLNFPIALGHFITGIVTICVKFKKKKNKEAFDEKATLSSIDAKHSAILGFIYSFGFMIPTILMFSFTTTLDKTFIQTFAIRSLTYDFIFTMLLSFTLIDRKIYKLRPIREFLVQIMLCLISIVLLEIIILTPNTPPDM